MMQLEKDFHVLDPMHAIFCSIQESTRLVVVERGPLLCLFNFSSTCDHTHLSVGVHFPHTYRFLLSSDAAEFDGDARFSLKEMLFRAVVDGQHAWNRDRPYALRISLAARSCTVLSML